MVSLFVRSIAKSYFRYEAPEVPETQSGALSNVVGDLSEYETEIELKAGIEKLEKEQAVVLSSLQDKFDPVSGGVCHVPLQI